MRLSIGPHYPGNSWTLAGTCLEIYRKVCPHRLYLGRHKYKIKVGNKVPTIPDWWGQGYIIPLIAALVSYVTVI